MSIEVDEVEVGRVNKGEKSEPAGFFETAIQSVAGNMATHFLRENIKRGGSLTIPSLGIRLEADGTVVELNLIANKTSSD